jgi:tetratricopeptide (TPR) repeat protein
MASVYFQTRDFDNAVIAADKAIAADPQSYAAMLIVASSLAESTKEFDLDKAEKLARVEKMASQALETLTASPRPRPDITDEMWAAARRDIGSQAFEARAIAARVDKKYDAAIAAFKRYAADTAQPEPRTMLMFSETYFAVKQWDNGIALLDPLIASPQMHPQIKKAAEDLKAQALKLKASAK